ncbi:MAG TPA: hypothetical protein VF796_07335 [Humisphaera sp.]
MSVLTLERPAAPTAPAAAADVPTAAPPARRGTVRRHRLIASVSRLWRWEFWPAWLFYAPVAAWIVLKSLRRGGLRGFASVTAANPGIPPDGGFVGESKRQILAALPADRVVPYFRVPPAPAADRAALVEREMAARGWSFPVVLKPDVGQRGAGVAVARNPADVGAHLAGCRGDLIAQRYHPGPHEAGVFYYRLPGEERGRIFSITEKVFPEVAGDGASTLADLVWRHPRYRMQARLFLARLAGRADEVLPAGHRVALGWVGNHCQGTLFRDGWHLWTPALEAEVDRVARAFPGFHFGRFDVRFTDPAAFSAGTDFGIVELNGVTSESTDIYDPARSLWSAWRKLARQWDVLFAIADANLALGYRPMPWRDLWRRVRLMP